MQEETAWGCVMPKALKIVDLLLPKSPLALDE